MTTRRIAMIIRRSDQRILAQREKQEDYGQQKRPRE